MCELVFNYLDLDYKKYVIQNPKFLRPEELPYLKGDSTKIRKLGWKPKKIFDDELPAIVEYYQNNFIW
jgi:GDPmannose 4,6-dehydratase